MPLKFKHAVSLEKQLSKMPNAYPIPDEVVGDICVDVGCNQGAFTVYAYPRFKRIFAIEPGRGALDAAMRNVEKRGINNVSFKRAGVSDEANKTLLLRHFPDPGGIDRSCDASTEIEELNWDLGTEYEEVPSITLPEVFN